MKSWEGVSRSLLVTSRPLLFPSGFKQLHPDCDSPGVPCKASWEVEKQNVSSVMRGKAFADKTAVLCCVLKAITGEIPKGAKRVEARVIQEDEGHRTLCIT